MISDDTTRERRRHSPAASRAGWTKICELLLVLTLLTGWPLECLGYSVLTHEAIIDAAWDTHIQPLLLKRFPQATPEELREAHAYAYGGAIIQDLGYYPHGSRFFSDLTHYVRSGDFILALIRNANDLNEYAFALGSMAHYPADNAGHSIATNRAVPILYPKLERKYGCTVTFEDDPLAHVKTEFGFDVLEIARHRYAPDSYHQFIGFRVAIRSLEQAFNETYGLELKDVLADQDKVLNSYRRDVSKLIPKGTRIAWALKQDEIQKDEPGITKKKFLYNLSRASYEQKWGKDYQKPTVGEHFLAFLYELLPKFGPLKILQLRTPTPQTEKMFEASFNATMYRYRKLLEQVGQGQSNLLDDNLDVGEVTGPGKYRLNDDTHAKLLDLLAKQNFVTASPKLRAELLQFYSDPDAPYSTKRDSKAWENVQMELEQLKSLTTPATPVASN